MSLLARTSEVIGGKGIAAAAMWRQEIFSCPDLKIDLPVRSRQKGPGRG